MTPLLDTLFEKGKVVSFAQNDFLIKWGKVSKAIFFLKEGIIRHFVYDTNGVEKTIRLSRENDFFYSSIVSYYNDEPTYINCQALTDSSLVQWDKGEIEKLFSENKDLDKFRYDQLTKFIVEKHKRELSLISKTAEERYRDFCEANLDLFNRIPHHIIASYLNMSPETLSRLRKKVFLI